MLAFTDTHQEFEALARQFLAQHPEVRHEWHQIRAMSGGRTDLVCGGCGADDVFTSLSNYQITIGTLLGRRDFEEFARGLSDKEVAEEAFAHFVALLGDAGLVQKASQHGA